LHIYLLPINKVEIEVTAPCIDDFSYKEFRLIEKYLNLDNVYAALGVPAAVGNFSVMSWPVNAAFGKTNDYYINMLSELQYLLASQIDMLIYQGNLDSACNTARTKRWTSNMV